MADSKVLAPELRDTEWMVIETVVLGAAVPASKELQQAQIARPESAEPAPAWFLHKDQLFGRKGFHQHLSLSLYHSHNGCDGRQTASGAGGGPSWLLNPYEPGKTHSELDTKDWGRAAYDVAVNRNFYLRMQNSRFQGGEDLQLNPGWQSFRLKYQLSWAPSHSR